MLTLSNLLAAGGGAYNPTDHVVPWKLHSEPLFQLFGEGYYLTNQTLMGFLAALLLLIAGLFAAKRAGSSSSDAEKASDYIVRGRFAQLLEVICEFVRESVTRPILGDLTDRYIKYIWSTFFFILFCNLLGLVPTGPILVYTAGLFMENGQSLEHFGGTATGTLAMTGALSLVSLFMFVFVGLRHQGMGYLAHFNPGPWYMAPILVPLEVLGLFIKAVSLSIRLFANMVGGHLIISALIGIIYTLGSYSFQGFALGGGIVLACAVVTLMEIFIAFLQAYIFTMLTVLFIGLGAVHDHDHDHDESHDHSEGASSTA